MRGDFLIVISTSHQLSTLRLITCIAIYPTPFVAGKYLSSSPNLTSPLLSFRNYLLTTVNKLNSKQFCYTSFGRLIIRFSPTLAMGRSEIRNICPVSLTTPADQQPKLHNRWHPDIPFAGTIKNGETVKIECVFSLFPS